MYRTQCLHFWGWLAQHHPLTLCEVSCSPALIIFLLCPALSKLASCPSPCPRLSEAQTRHSQTMAEEQLSPLSFSWDMALTQHTGLKANKLSGSTIWHASLLPSGIWGIPSRYDTVLCLCPKGMFLDSQKHQYFCLSCFYLHAICLTRTNLSSCILNSLSSQYHHILEVHL